MSHLDRFLIFESVISSWQVSAQWVGDRDISDHCPIWLVCSNSDWGPKPFRFNNCWLEHKDFKAFVEACWGNFHVQGWKTHVFKEKLKLLKGELRKWNKEVFGDADLSIEKIVEEMNILDGWQPQIR